MEKDHHSEIMRSLGRLEAGLEAVIERLNKVNGRLDKHDDKIEELEARKNQGIGKIAIISTVGATIFGLIGAIISGHYFK